MDNTAILKCPFTRSTNFQKVFEYNEKPEGEIQFSFNAGKQYHREIWQCVDSRHYLSIHDMDMSQIYSEEYVNSTYQDEDGLNRTFQRIIGLDPGQSDNAGRIKHVDRFAKEYFKDASRIDVLDVGSGLGVFPFGIQQAGYRCTALDPDQRAAKHMNDRVGVNAVCADFMNFDTLQRFDIITFNKVLEHVHDPAGMLARSKEFLKDDGFIYIEIPDGEMAAREGKHREEFFIDHIHVFSFLSTLLFIQKSGFEALAVERLREPSTKYTLRAFLRLTST
ncbi:MAG: class I SAM-dependent methyltransferase [Candidatus Omnitrophota bacterium]